MPLIFTYLFIAKMLLVVIISQYSIEMALSLCVVVGNNTVEGVPEGISRFFPA